MPNVGRERYSCEIACTSSLIVSGALLTRLCLTGALLNAPVRPLVSHLSPSAKLFPRAFRPSQIGWRCQINAVDSIPCHLKHKDDH